MHFPYKIIDLTHSLHEGIPTWDGGCGFRHDVALDYLNCSTDVKFRVHKIKMQAGIGTHMDAPAHCIPGALTIDELSFKNLVAPCVVIDISQVVHESYSLFVANILY